MFFIMMLIYFIFLLIFVRLFNTIEQVRLIQGILQSWWLWASAFYSIGERFSLVRAVLCRTSPNTLFMQLPALLAAFLRSAAGCWASLSFHTPINQLQAYFSAIKFMVIPSNGLILFFSFPGVYINLGKMDYFGMWYWGTAWDGGELRFLDIVIGRESGGFLEALGVWYPGNVGQVLGVLDRSEINFMPASSVSLFCLKACLEGGEVQQGNLSGFSPPRSPRISPFSSQGDWQLVIKKTDFS